MSGTVHQAISALMGDLGGIGKTGHNKEQNYDFRGIEEVLKHVHPLLAKHGVLIVPNVIEREYEERISKQGTVGHCAHVHVSYRIYGPEGDHLEASTWGEAMDYSDKATNKAMTAAFKYLLFELLAIADAAEDADRESPDGAKRNKAAAPPPQPPPPPIPPKDQVRVDYLRDEVRRMLREIPQTRKPTKKAMEAAGDPEAVHALVLAAYEASRAEEDAALRGEPGELPLKPGDEAPALLVSCPRCGEKVPTGELAEHLGIEHEGAAS